MKRRKRSRPSIDISYYPYRRKKIYLGKKKYPVSYLLGNAAGQKSNQYKEVRKHD